MSGFVEDKLEKRQKGLESWADPKPEFSRQRDGVCLFNFNFSACFFELCFYLFSFSFGYFLLYGSGNLVNEFLGLFQSETGDLLNDLHDLELGLAG